MIQIRNLFHHAHHFRLIKCVVFNRHFCASFARNEKEEEKCVQSLMHHMTNGFSNVSNKVVCCIAFGPAGPWRAQLVCTGDAS